MTKRRAKGEKEARTVVANDPEDRKGALKSLGGSQSDHWNNTLAMQAIGGLWLKHSGAGHEGMLSLEKTPPTKDRRCNIYCKGLGFGCGCTETAGRAIRRPFQVVQQ